MNWTCDESDVAHEQKVRGLNESLAIGEKTCSWESVLVVFVRKRESNPAAAALGSWNGAAAGGWSGPCWTAPDARASCFSYYLWTCALRTGTFEARQPFVGDGEAECDGDLGQHAGRIGLPVGPASVEKRPDTDVSGHGKNPVAGHQRECTMQSCNGHPAKRRKKKTLTINNHFKWHLFSMATTCWKNHKLQCQGVKP